MKQRIRIGTGFDIHRVKRGVPLVLGTVEIPSDFGLVSATDGDVVTHALIDSLLAAAGAPDIGTCFPGTDERWRGKPSEELLRATITEHLGSRFKLLQADITILAEQPRLAPHYESIRRALADALQVPSEQISLKARTLEGLGAIGEGVAIAALVNVLAEVGEAAPEADEEDLLFPENLALSGKPAKDACLAFADGGSRGNPGPAACACVVLDQDGVEIGSASRFLGEATNNQAEYEGLLLALRELERLGLQQKAVVIHLDSSLVFHQVTGKFRVKSPDLRKLVRRVAREIAKFEKVRLALVPRGNNRAADRLVNQALDRHSG
ncbi:MAG: 2-C-methyl-D-erythritol 2,4-cyclodiphosphate synthase [Planctomycetales bacterium 4484_113]|nr:MAG: 2-C-methyl-D-erythritol 2,4-cyclodiphosphate synthase [Planctomycetales bacterium 4484_113]